jgi:hypothetical protein
VIVELAQAAPGITINFPTVDWPTLIPQLVGYFFDGIGTYLNDALHTAFDGLWGSGPNVLGNTDMAMTWGFGPVHDQVTSIQSAVRAVLLFALVLLGLRGMLGAIVPKQPDLIAEFVNGFLGAVILVSAFPIFIPEVIGWVNSAAAAVGKADLSGYLSTSMAPNPLVQLVLFVILLFFAIRLLIKAVWRIGFLAVLLPVGAFAMVAYAIPQLRWLTGWWARTWGGMLVAQIPAVFALTIGAQLFAYGAGLGAFVYAIAFLQLAYDLYDLIPFGHVRGQGSSLPLGQLPRPKWGAAPAAITPAGATTHLTDAAVSQLYGY